MARTDFELCLLLRVSMSYAKIRPCHFHRSFFLTQVQAVPAAECSTERLTDGVNVQRKWCLDPHPVNVYCLCSLFAENWPCQLPRSWTRGLHVGHSAADGTPWPFPTKRKPIATAVRYAELAARSGTGKGVVGPNWLQPLSSFVFVVAPLVSPVGLGFLAEICRAGLGQSPPLSGICS